MEKTKRAEGEVQLLKTKMTLDRVICEECGCELSEDYVCESCGLVNDEYMEMDDEFPHFTEEQIHHGSPVDHNVPDIAVMTCVNTSECKNPELRRAFRWDGYFGWDVQKTMILQKEIKDLCEKLKFNERFIDHCYYFLRRYRDKIIFTGTSLEDATLSLVYLFIRLNAESYTLLDFKRLGYDTSRVWGNFINFVRTLNLSQQIKQQDAAQFVEKAVDYLLFFNHFYPNLGEIRQRFVLVNYVINQFTGIYKKMNSKGLIELSDNGLKTIGALLYLSTKNVPDYRVSQKEIADACGISDVTLRKYIKKLKEYYKILERMK